MVSEKMAASYQYSGGFALPRLLMADLNAGPILPLSNRQVARLRRFGRKRQATFRSWFSVLCIDHIFVRGLAVNRAEIAARGSPVAPRITCRWWLRSACRTATRRSALRIS